MRLVGEVSAGLVAGWTVVACEIGNAGRSSTHALQRWLLPRYHLEEALAACDLDCKRRAPSEKAVFIVRHQLQYVEVVMRTWRCRCRSRSGLRLRGSSKL